MFDFLLHDFLLVKFNAGRYGQNTLAAMNSRADIIAKTHFFPHLHEQLAGHTCAEDGIAYLQGGIVGMAHGNGGGIAHAEFALGHIQSCLTLGKFLW